MALVPPVPSPAPPPVALPFVPPEPGAATEPLGEDFDDEVDGTPVPAAPVTPPASAAPAPSKPLPTRWRVAESHGIWWFGMRTTLRVGSEVSIADYGADGVSQLVAQGVKLEPLDE